MPYPGFKCYRCGRCCKTVGAEIYLSDEDVLKLLRAREFDVLMHILHSPVPEDMQVPGMPWEAWYTLNGEECKSCPYARKRKGKDYFYCKIYGLRPSTCSDFPGSIEHGVRCGCPSAIADNQSKAGGTGGAAHPPADPDSPKEPT